jgi:hypothetical protein
MGVKISLAVIAASAVMFATAAHPQDAPVSRGVDWKCHDGIIMRYDRVGEDKRDSTETLTITGIRRGLNNLHITCGKRGCPLLNGKRCVIQD